MSENHNTMPENHNTMPEDHNIMPENHNIMPENHNVMPENHNIMPEDHNIMPENHITPDKQNLTTDGYEGKEVTFYASFALRVPVSENYAATKAGKRNKFPSHAYRFAYKLLPTEDTTRIDVALFGSVVKLYCKDQTLCLKVYEERGSIWMAWSKVHSVRFTDKTLLSLFDHVCNVTVSNVGDKVRRDHPKGFRASDSFYESIQFIKMYSKWSEAQGETFDPNEIRDATVLQRSGFLLDLHDKLSQKSVGLEDVPPWHEVQEIFEDFPDASLESPETTPSESLGALPVTFHSFQTCSLQPLTNSNYKRLYDWVIARTSVVEKSEFFQRMDTVHPHSGGMEFVAHKSSVKLARSSTVSSFEHKRDKKRPSRVEVFLQMKMQAFFSGSTTQVTKMDQHHYSGIKDGIFLVHADEQLLSSEQKFTFNPLTVTIWRIEDLPELPDVNDDEIPVLYDPVYLKYKLPNHKVRLTNAYKHNTKQVALNDQYIFLLGKMSPAQIREFFSGPPLTIEVHDRDNRETYKDLPSVRWGIYGSESSQKPITSSLAASQEIELADTFRKPYSMYGVAKLNLYEFLLGRTELDFCEQVMCCVAQKRQQDIVQKYTKENFNPDDIYLQAGTAVEVRLSLSFPVAHAITEISQQVAITSYPYFARAIFRLTSAEKSLIYKLLTIVTVINASQLAKEDSSHIRCFPFLSSLVAGGAQRMDVITGVHVFDKENHIFCLEGEATGSMQLLLKNITIMVEFGAKVLCNSAMIFEQRLYLNLPSFVHHLHLYKSTKILLNDRKFMFDSTQIGVQCFKGLQNVYNLTNCSTLDEATRNGFFLTDDMILAMNQLAGYVVTTDQITDMMRVAPQQSTRHCSIPSMMKTAYSSKSPRPPLVLPQYKLQKEKA